MDVGGEAADHGGELCGSARGLGDGNGGTELTTSQLFGWRRLARAGRLGSVEATGFAAALVVPEACGGETTTSTGLGNGLGAGRMEISVGRARIVVDAGVDGAALARVLEILRRSSDPKEG